MTRIELKNMGPSKRFDISIEDVVDHDGSFTLIECDNPIPFGDKIIIRVFNVGIPGVIGPGLEFDLTELISNTLKDALKKASS